MKQSKIKQSIKSHSHSDSHFWFVKKGFIMLPQGWKGYLVIIAYILLIFTGFQQWDHEAMKNIFFMFVFTCILLYIAYKKGDKKIWLIPNWR